MFFAVVRHDCEKLMLSMEHMHLIGLIAEEYKEGEELLLQCEHCTFEALHFFFEEVFTQYVDAAEDELAFNILNSKVQAHLQKQIERSQETVTRSTQMQSPLFGLVLAARYLKSDVMINFLILKSGLLHQAAEFGQAEVLHALIEGKCDVNAQVSKSGTMCIALELASNETCEAILIAAHFSQHAVAHFHPRRHEIIQQLTDFYNIHNQDRISKVPEVIIKYSDRVPELNKALLKKYGCDLSSFRMSSTMKDSVRHGDVRGMHRLLDQKACVNARDTHGNTATIMLSKQTSS